MEVNNSYKTVHYQSKISFQPLLNVLKRTLQHGSSEGAKKLYSGILDYADQHAELQYSIDDVSALEPHHEWIAVPIPLCRVGRKLKEPRQQVAHRFGGQSPQRVP